MTHPYATGNTRSAARRLVDALEVAEDLRVTVWHAEVGQNACTLVVVDRGEAERLAGALELRPARYGWWDGPKHGPSWADPAQAVAIVVELEGRPEVHPGG